MHQKQTKKERNRQTDKQTNKQTNTQTLFQLRMHNFLKREGTGKKVCKKPWMKHSGVS